MPCSCIVDKPTYPQNEEWGPHLWLILHTLAEKAGRQTNAITMGDEQRIWPLFIRALPATLPCPYCRDHLQTYTASHPFELPSTYHQVQAYIRKYIYDLHEDVNTRLGKKSFPFDDLQTTYTSIAPLSSATSKLESLVKKAIQMGGVSLFHWRAWLKQFLLLKAAIL